MLYDAELCLWSASYHEVSLLNAVKSPYLLEGGKQCWFFAAFILFCPMARHACMHAAAFLEWGIVLLELLAMAI